MKSIIYTRDDGRVSVFAPSSKWEDTLKKLATFVVPKGVPYEIVETSTIPQDRTFRDAWEKNGKTVRVNMDKARGIHMGRIQSARDRKLLDLDIEQLKGNDVADAKQTLRKLLDTFDLTGAGTPDALKALWPSEVPRI